MKCKNSLVITAILLLGSASVSAQNASDTDVLLGAAAGAALGSTIGQGDGKKIATVIGGLLGAGVARDMAREAQARSEYGRDNGYDVKYRTDPYFVKQRIIRYCQRNIPIRYADYPEAARAWVDGCVRREMQIQREFEAQAYRDGLDH